MRFKGLLLSSAFIALMCGFVTTQVFASEEEPVVEEEIVLTEEVEQEIIEEEIPEDVVIEEDVVEKIDEQIVWGQWIFNNGKWQYGIDHELVKSTILPINGVSYAFDANGYMMTGWVKMDGVWYYAQSNGALVEQNWLHLGSYWYYLDADGVMVSSGEKEIGQATYYFEQSGAMKTGWQRIGDNWKYYQSSGARLDNNWLKYYGSWYYLGEQGIMASNEEKVIGQSTYCFLDSGAMVTGWKQFGEDWKYYQSSGARLNNEWLKYYGYWYYFDEDGIMVSDEELTIDGNTYSFNSDGTLVTGWKSTSDGWIYFDVNTGKVMDTFKKIGSYYFYFDENGIMYNESTLEMDGTTYHLREDGSIKAGWVSIGNDWMYLQSNMQYATGWLQFGYDWYYFYKEDTDTPYIMATSTNIEGYEIAYNGVWNASYDYARKVLDRVGWNLAAAYNYVVTFPYVKYVEDPAYGTYNYAMHGFQYGSGNCYVMASTFYTMAILLGYDAHQVAGTVSTVIGPSNHSWVEIDMDGTTYIFDPDFEVELHRNGYYLRYGASGVLRYYNYHRMN